MVIKTWLRPSLHPSDSLIKKAEPKPSPPQFPWPRAQQAVVRVFLKRAGARPLEPGHPPAAVLRLKNSNMSFSLSEKGKFLTKKRQLENGLFSQFFTAIVLFRSCEVCTFPPRIIFFFYGNKSLRKRSRSTKS